MEIIHFYSVKGGAGCSTNAAREALTSEVRTHLLDLSPSQDMNSLLGASPDATEINDKLTVGTDIPDDIELLIVDHGVIRTMEDLARVNVTADDITTICCMRNDYLSAAAYISNQMICNRVYLLEEPNRALKRNDFRNITGQLVNSVEYSHDIQRATDAGMLHRVMRLTPA